MISFFSALSKSARVGIAIGATLVLALSIAAALALTTMHFNTLFTDLREDDAAQISDQLQQWKVPFEIRDDGRTLAVPDDQVNNTRLRLVSAGVPSGGRVGFELFKDSNFGVTEFAQRVNFQRALQGELERTIASFAAVEHVRVHLNLSESSGLLGKNQPKKASVALGLRPHTQLDPSQVRGIQNLVSAAVDDLQVDSVVVLDEAGTPLLAGSLEPFDGALDARLREQSRIEQHIAQRIAQLLGPVFAEDEVRIGVDVLLNFDQVSAEREIVRPQGEAGASLVVRETRSNRSSTAGNATSSAPAKGAQTQIEYQHGRDLEHVISAPGRIERLSVAVLLPARTDENTITALNSLLAAAVGLRPQRGDRIEVAALIQRPRLPADAATSNRAGAEPEIRMQEPATSPSAPAAMRLLGGWLLAGSIGALCLLLGVIAGRSSQRKRLSPREREQAMARVKAWLNADEAVS